VLWPFLLRGLLGAVFYWAWPQERIFSFLGFRDETTLVYVPFLLVISPTVFIRWNIHWYVVLCELYPFSQRLPIGLLRTLPEFHVALFHQFFLIPFLTTTHPYLKSLLQALANLLHLPILLFPYNPVL